MIFVVLPTLKIRILGFYDPFHHFSKGSKVRALEPIQASTKVPVVVPKLHFNDDPHFWGEKFNHEPYVICEDWIYSVIWNLPRTPRGLHLLQRPAGKEQNVGLVSSDRIYPCIHAQTLGSFNSFFHIGLFVWMWFSWCILVTCLVNLYCVYV